MEGTISNDLKLSNDFSEVVKTANKLKDYIGRPFVFKSEKVILTLFSSLKCPQLEYGTHFWSPIAEKKHR